jgi:flagellar export protein FliJ
MSEAFTLEAVLRLRQHKEDIEERALAELGTQRQQVQSMLDRVRQQKQLWTEDRSGEKGLAGTGATQQSTYARLALLHEAEKQLQEQQQDLQKRIYTRQAAYLAARHAREMLTELKRSQSESRRLLVERREQRRLEDLFLGRWSR